MAGPHGGEPVAVEPADPGGDRLVVPSSDLVCGSRVARAISNGQQRSGALDLRGGGAERAAQAGQLLALIRRERAKGIVPVARHGTPRGTRIASPRYQIPRQSAHQVPPTWLSHEEPMPPIDREDVPPLASLAASLLASAPVVAQSGKRRADAPL